MRRWILPNAPDHIAPDGIPPLVARILASRGIEVSAMADFIAAKPVENGPPMLDMDRAVERLRRALAARERIVVYGDYDVDGIADTLHQALTMSPEDQEARMTRMRETLDEYNVYRWAGSLVGALSKVHHDAQQPASA